MNTNKLAFVSKLAVASFLLASVGLLTFGSGSVYALSLGTNITKYDGLAGGTGIGSEDNEAEPGMVQSQSWDLEAFQLQNDRKQLSVVGGYNFYAGFGGTAMGDIFIGKNGRAIYSADVAGFDYNAHGASGYAPLSNVFNYDYVINVNWTTGAYSIFSLNSNSQLLDTEYGSSYNTHSNPWRYASDGSVVQGSQGNISSLLRANVYSDAETGFSGWDIIGQHFVATFDVSSISSYLDGGAIFHTTMQCGNDNLIGDAAPVPEPGTIMLLGMGMLGLAVYGKRRMNKEA